MPAFSTHYIFAEELMPFLNEIADFTLCEEAVLIGTQGPDIFFFHRVFPWMPGRSLRRAGSRLHRSKPGDILQAMRSYCEKSENKDVARSYVWGFILHYVLDRKCHPYVYSLQEKIKKDKPYLNSHSVHNEIEFAADVYFLNRRFQQEKPYLFDTSKTISSDSGIAEEIGRLWESVLPAVTGIETKKKHASLAIGDTKRIQRFLLDRYSVKRTLIAAGETVLAPVIKNFKFTSMFRPKDLEKAKKYVNINSEKWISPYSNRESSLSFEQLFEEAKAEAKIMLLEYKAGRDCREITKNISFLTGVEAQ